MSGRVDQSKRVSRLRERLDLLRERYGRIDEDLGPLETLEMNAARRRSRIDLLERQIAESRREIALLTQERAGYLAGVEALLTDLVARIEQRHGEAWMPTAIPGYRMWNITQGQVTGAVTPWTRRSKRAVCLNGVTGEDLPHSNGRCGPPPCGIYATKKPEYVYERIQRMRNWAIGLVALAGKVVEHTHGYRAQRASIEALCMIMDGHRLHLDEPIAIEAALLDPGGIAGTHGDCAGSDAAELEAAIEFLTARERSMSWT